jgi:putative NIF3 family GTP cyclohydrolase 1 type 2
MFTAMTLSRRSFLHASATLAAAGLPWAARPAAQTTLTAGEVLRRIKDRVGIPWRPQTVDTLIAGTPETRVRGIATTMMATLEVVQRAAAAGRNLVITHEPTFYSHQDTRDPLTADPAYRFKDQFLREHDMAVFRFHDHWHAMRPDGIALGMARELGWEKQADPANLREFTFPGVPLAELADHVRDRLGARTLRVVGDPALRVNRAAASWGYFTFNPANLTINRPDIDLFIVGETREWETVEHAQDLMASGRKKALIVIGHVASEQAGMKYCAEWLKGIVSEVPIAFLPAAEPFWTPGQPRR